METMLVRKLHLSSWKLTWRGGKSQPFANTFPPNPAMWEKRGVVPSRSAENPPDPDEA